MYCFASKTSEANEMDIRHAELVLEAAEEGVVLLENNGVLPLKNKGKIALFGNGARDTVKGGSGSGDVFPRHFSSVEEGLEKAGYEITSKAWIDAYSSQLRAKKASAFMRLISAMQNAKEGQDKNQDLSEILKGGWGEPEDLRIQEQYLDASETDTCVYVISRTAGETADRTLEKGDYYLTDVEYENLQSVAKTYANVVVVINAGGVIDTKFFKEIPGLGALVVMSQGGQCGGEALANILTGTVTPSGKLSATWACNYMDYPNAATFASRNGNPFEAYYHEGIYVGYPFFDSYDVSPAYAFGFGKSYTEFKFLNAEAMQKDNEIVVSVIAKNTGSCYSGKEVLQVYYSAPNGKLRKAKQKLGAFCKTKLLAPQEEQAVELRIPISSMSSYDSERAAYVLEQGEYLIRLGNSSRNTKIIARFFVNEEVITQQLDNRMIPDVVFDEFDPVGFEPWSYPFEKRERKNAPAYYLDLSLVHTAQKEKLCEEFQQALRERADQLTVDELALLVNGENASAAPGAPLFAGQSTPGVSGETTRHIEGLPSVLLADGPAGLRILDHFQADAEGNILNLEFNFLAMFMGGSRIFEERDGISDYYQYTTALPVGTLLAQTFNTKLVERVGAAVGEEMERFGIQLWLAPGMNIHRNPLCGRNFEYYSEDPLLSGKMAAAMVRGAQAVYGSATIKHFAANNQEDWRTECNNHISERALREIYLKGFEIAVKEGMPDCIMTSYNLNNGIHSANSYDLCTSIARDEWGFEGMIMSDWGTTASRRCKAVECIKAGNDLIMPGSNADVQEIVDAVNRGELKREALKTCVMRVLRCIAKTRNIQ